MGQGFFRAALAVSIGGAIAVAACVGDDPATPATVPDGGSSGVPNGCASDQKSCNGTCVTISDPLYGCSPTSCSPCSAGAPNATASCNAGACAVVCNAGFENCDGNAANGCEVNVGSDVANCGKCGNVCGDANTTARACNAGKCEPTCTAGFAHCGASDAAGCEANVASDAANCKTCGHSCQGGTCSSGECSTITVADGQKSPKGIALDATYVFWVRTFDSLIMRQPKAATAPCTDTACQLIAGTGGDVHGPHALAVEGSSLFYSNQNGGSPSIRRASNAASSTSTVIGTSDQTKTGFLAVGGGQVFWSNASFQVGVGADGRIQRTATTATSLAQITVAVGNDYTAGLAADATHVYWAGDGALYRSPVNAGACTTGAGGTCQSVATGISLYAVALDATHVYWSEVGASKTIKKAPKGGGAPIVLATNQENAVSLATDGVHVYWGTVRGGDNSNDTVRRVKVDVTTPCDDAQCEEVAKTPVPSSIALDDKLVYWVRDTVDFGAVYKKAK